MPAGSAWPACVPSVTCAVTFVFAWVCDAAPRLQSAGARDRLVRRAALAPLRKRASTPRGSTRLHIVRRERLIAALGDTRLHARKEERTWLRELTAGAPELHGQGRRRRRCCNCLRLSQKSDAPLSLRRRRRMSRSEALRGGSETNPSPRNGACSRAADICDSLAC